MAYYRLLTVCIKDDYIKDYYVQRVSFSRCQAKNLPALFFNLLHLPHTRRALVCKQMLCFPANSVFLCFGGEVKRGNIFLRVTFSYGRAVLGRATSGLAVRYGSFHARPWHARQTCLTVDLVDGWLGCRAKLHWPRLEPLTGVLLRFTLARWGSEIRYLIGTRSSTFKI